MSRKKPKKYTFRLPPEERNFRRDHNRKDHVTRVDKIKGVRKISSQKIRRDFHNKLLMFAAANAVQMMGLLIWCLETEPNVFEKPKKVVDPNPVLITTRIPAETHAEIRARADFFHVTMYDMIDWIVGRRLAFLDDLMAKGQSPFTVAVGRTDIQAYMLYPDAEQRKRRRRASQQKWKEKWKAARRKFITTDFDSPKE